MTREGPRNYSSGELFKARKDRMYYLDVGDYNRINNDVKRKIPPLPSFIKRDKNIFLLINIFGGNLLGLDRIYTGCIMSGFVKLALLLLSIYMVITDNKNSKIPIIVFFIWVYIDAILVIINSLKRNKESPYCGGYMFYQISVNFSILLSILFGLVVFGLYPFIIYKYYPKLP